MTRLAWMFLGWLAASAPALAAEPILDMHLHARLAGYSGANPPPMCAPFSVMPRWDVAQGPDGLTFNLDPPCADPIPAATTDAAVMAETLAVMRRRNIIGMVSGEPELMRRWKAAAPERIIAGIDLRLPGTPGAAHVKALTPEDLRRLRASGELQVLAEVMAQYEGLPPGDPRLEPYWALAEKLDIPVGIHMGPAGPGEPYADGAYRVRNGAPLLLEEVLVRHPRLRVYVMHAGYPFSDDLRALFFSYPQVYADVGSIVYTEPRAAFYRFLQEVVEAGYGDRIMFGSDQMIWPGVIEPSIAAIEQAPFLSTAQKRDILYNNAARFLRLSPEQIAAHHRMGEAPD